MCCVGAVVAVHGLFPCALWQYYFLGACVQIGVRPCCVFLGVVQSKSSVLFFPRAGSDGGRPLWVGRQNRCRRLHLYFITIARLFRVSVHENFNVRTYKAR